MYTQKKIYTHGTPIVHTTNQLYTWRSMCATIEVMITVLKQQCSEKSCHEAPRLFLPPKLRAIVDIAVYSKQRRIERIVKDDESCIRNDTCDCPVIAQIARAYWLHG